MRTLILIGTMVGLAVRGWADGPQKMTVTVQRVKTAEGLVTGTLTIDGQESGTVYENDERKIPAGTYRGVIRTTSQKNFAQGPGGKLGKSGDFLLEIAGVLGRSDILFHAGNKKEHSEGCVLCGPAGKDPATGAPLAPEPLKKLRLAFFETDTPNATPNKHVEIVVLEPKR